MRKIIVAAAAAAALTVLGSPAAAHVITVDPPGQSDTKEGWVGGGALPGQGKGLVPGGPDGSFKLSPAHAKGLNSACKSTEANPSAVDIRGPGGPGCAHGQ
ncbi:hypothetical protein [Isoptericola croceus]|uniref:hypothetical protein n=1 Tax=Isoptericola croceus TaxID=3031406 RepID=UPI0023FA295F|nr:hypothetical protein [Isoptericola croceus]